jgi:NADH-quinone oxidoreductase subunit K
MVEVHLLYDTLIVGALLFGIGLVGFLARRNMIVMFLAAEMMLQGVSLSLTAWGRLHNNWGGQVLVIFILTVAACEAGIALALVLMLHHRSGRLDIAFWQSIRESNQPVFVDQELPDEEFARPVWPELPASGIEPPTDVEERIEREQRTHV